MSIHETQGERARAQEDEYFRKRDLELVEKMRQKVAAEEARAALGEKTGIGNIEYLEELRQLGFTPDTVALLPLVPVLQMAWAEGGVTPVERNLIEKLANTRGIAAGSPADAQLMDWLANKPSDDVFAGATRLIRAMLASGSEQVSNLTADDLVKYCEQIAAASGGIFGLGRVSGEEKALLTSIAADLKGRGC